jgi:hypothetical protein
MKQWLGNLNPAFLFWMTILVLIFTYRAGLLGAVAAIWLMAVLKNIVYILTVIIDSILYKSESSRHELTQPLFFLCLIVLIFLIIVPVAYFKLFHSE